MDRLRYAARRLSSGTLHWIRRRFTPAGWLILAGLGASAVVGADTNHGMAYQIFTFLLSLLVLSSLCGLFFRGRFSVRRTLPRFGTAGQPLPYRLEIRNLDGRAHRGLLLGEDLPDPRPSFDEFRSAPQPEAAAHWVDQALGGWLDRALGLSRWRRLVSAAPVVKERALPDLPAHGSFEVTTQLTPARRGRLRLTGLTVVKTDPLGLFRAQVRRPQEESALILPRRYPVPRLALPGRRRYQQGGVALSSSVGDSQEFVSLRDYRAGDPLRRVHWKSWARTGKLIVKEYQDEYFIRHGLVLDTFGAPGEAFEEAVSVAASFACSVLTQESLLDLLFVGAQAHCVTAGRGLGGAERLLEVLAGVQPCADKPFEELSRSVLRRRSELSGCLIVLLGWDDARRDFVAALRSLSVPTVTVVIDGAAAGPLPEGVHRLERGKVAEGLSRL